MEVNLTCIKASLKHYFVELFNLSDRMRLLASGQRRTQQNLPTNSSTDLEEGPTCIQLEKPLLLRLKSTFASVKEASARSVTSGGETLYNWRNLRAGVSSIDLHGLASS
ncbi:two component transcriptional regulator [Striga asiatica]|uniref:Two component transcriptional regulator n=1 Tax=Striga asiatica TaxID=4170 RepID=A0A5A7RC26_STRAF|nr:two component transcriptional regulator [Striga asiatica]